jgi:hypothetical protein
MPNWCLNNLRISHKDPKMMERAVRAWNDGHFLQEFLPCPKFLTDTMSGCYGKMGDDPIQNYQIELHNFQTALNKKYFGFTDWYDWCVSNWGTKWDIGLRAEYGERAELKGDCLTLDFESAWSPPLAAYTSLEEMGFSIEAYYYEPGMGFCGEYNLGCDETYPTSDPPEHIDEMFGISETKEHSEE